MSLALAILDKYFGAQKELVEVETIDERSVIVSLPIHFSAHTRVEVAVTKLNENQYALSDMAKVVGELEDAGHKVEGKLRERILNMIKISKVTLSGGALIRTCTEAQLGAAIHEFSEAAKTIGDAYLVYPRSGGKSKAEDDLRAQVRKTFQQKRYMYKERGVVRGEVEEHKVDFLIEPNGAKGLALGVLVEPDRLHAEAWGFRAQDIKKVTKDRLLVGLLYNDAKAKDASRNIIEKVVDIAIASTEINAFGDTLERLGLSRGHA
jgi:uncharacterized protein DUF1828